MVEIVSNINDGTIVISDKYDFNVPLQFSTDSINADMSDLNATPVFFKQNEEFILSFPNLQNVSKIKKFWYDTIGLTNNRFLLPYYRISRDGNSWTEWLDLKRYVDNFPLIDPKDPLYLEIKWKRVGDNETGIIRLLEFKIEGELERNVEEPGDSKTIKNGDSLIIKPPYIFKVFKITNTEIISSTGIPSGCSIKYRYSQDNSRTWSNWENFNDSNISTARINPIRFFEIEYLIENNSGQNISIQDINLIGDFQNVSEDYKKTNLFGIRECCQSNLLGAYDKNGNFIPNSNMNQTGNGNNCDVNSGLPQMTDDEKANLYNPYSQNAALNLLNKLSTDAQQVFGHQVIYFVIDPDKGGIDTTLHEYQLYNVTCKGDLKVSIEGNNFPDSQIVMNQFDLNLFETMEAHITKQQFKEIFGAQRRPGKGDFLYFCNLNRMYQVDHSQQFRGFNNNSVYYKLILKKFNNSSNINYANSEIKNTVNELTKNTTIDELFGQENREQKNAIANKLQHSPLSRERIRLEINAKIEKELIENSSNIISKAHYDLSSVAFGSVAVKYLNFYRNIGVSDNFSYMCWFNINNYIPGEIYNFYNFYNESDEKGFKMELINDEIKFKINKTEYSFNLTGTPTNDAISLEEETWYCYLININQRSNELEQFIYKRDVDDEDDAVNLVGTKLRQVYKNKQNLTPDKFVLEIESPTILGSDMKITNIRLFNDIAPEDYHNKLLNQYIIGDDSKNLIIADNATTRLYLPGFPLYE